MLTEVTLGTPEVTSGKFRRLKLIETARRQNKHTSSCLKQRKIDRSTSESAKTLLQKQLTQDLNSWAEWTKNWCSFHWFVGLQQLKFLFRLVHLSLYLNFGRNLLLFLSPLRVVLAEFVRKSKLCNVCIQHLMITCQEIRWHRSGMWSNYPFSWLQY